MPKAKSKTPHALRFDPAALQREKSPRTITVGFNPEPKLPAVIAFTSGALSRHLNQCEPALAAAFLNTLKECCIRDQSFEQAGQLREVQRIYEAAFANSRAVRFGPQITNLVQRIYEAAFANSLSNQEQELNKRRKALSKQAAREWRSIK